MSAIEKMWDDPRFKLLHELDRLFESSKIWGGTEWVYQSIPAPRYQRVAEMVRVALWQLNQEYGIESE